MGRVSFFAAGGQRGVRPFDAKSAGMSLRKRCGFVMKLKRPREPWGDDFGPTDWWASCDAHHVTAPHPRRRRSRAMQSARRAAWMQSYRLR